MLYLAELTGKDGKHSAKRRFLVRVLVVEDAKDMNRLIVKTLKKAGYSVDG